MLTTVGTRAQAEQLAQQMVAQRLAACAQIDAIVSVYRWDGALRQDEELRLSLKTTAARWPALQAALQAAHPYALAQIVALPVADASPAYAAWVAQETAS